MSLLGAADPPPFAVHNAGGAAAVLVVCDHAANAVPAALGTLGLEPADLATHIGWDIGARDITLWLAAQLGAPAVTAAYSRLVIDCNRYRHDPAAALAQSDGVTVPANTGLAAADLGGREAAIHGPYHAAIAGRLDAMGGAAPVLISVHTMTDKPRLGERRAWEMCVCWARDGRIALPLIARLRAAGIVTGDNQPYSLDIGEDYTVPEHAMRRGLAHLQIEFRQDLVATPAQARRWAAALLAALRPLLDAPAIRARGDCWPGPGAKP